MLIPGLSGHEGRVRRYIAGELRKLGLKTRTDRLGNLIATLEGDADAPSVMLFTHMDQLGFVVRKIEADGFIRVERLGGVPERALPSQAVTICVGEGRDRVGLIANKSHHATTPDEKYKVVPYMDLYIDAGFASRAEAEAAGVLIGTPIVYRPQVSSDLRERASPEPRSTTAPAARSSSRWPGRSSRLRKRPTVHFVFSVQEEFNLRGALTAAQVLKPDICIQLDLLLATDTPDMGYRGDVTLGGGPAMSLYSFHGRGTLNGTIPHPALVALFEETSRAEKHSAAAQRPYRRADRFRPMCQLVEGGVASIDVGFPMRYSHSSLEVCDLGDLEQLDAACWSPRISAIDKNFSLDRDDYVG